MRAAHAAFCAAALLAAAPRAATVQPALLGAGAQSAEEALAQITAGLHALGALAGAPCVSVSGGALHDVAAALQCRGMFWPAAGAPHPPARAHDRAHAHACTRGCRSDQRGDGRRAGSPLSGGGRPPARRASSAPGGPVGPPAAALSWAVLATPATLACRMPCVQGDAEVRLLGPPCRCPCRQPHATRCQSAQLAAGFRRPMVSVGDDGKLRLDLRCGLLRLHMCGHHKSHVLY